MLSAHLPGLMSAPSPFVVVVVVGGGVITCGDNNVGGVETCNRKLDMSVCILYMHTKR